MQYQTTWLDIVYEATFSTPAFRLARENIEVLSILFKHLAPQYSVRPSDMHVSGGTALSDVKARISLFTGNGVLEITADKFSATFTNAVGQQDIENDQGLYRDQPECPDRMVAQLDLQGTRVSNNGVLEPFVVIARPPQMTF